MQSELDTAPAFPAVSAALTLGNSPHSEVKAFLGEVTAWRESALAWLEEQAMSGGLSDELRRTLKWALGTSGQPAAALSAYRVSPFSEPRGAESEQVLDVLTWRSGVVHFLSDVWDTLGAAYFEMEECQLAIDALFTPAALRGSFVCPDCIQLLPAVSAEASAHYFACPIRRRRDDATPCASNPTPWTPKR